MARWETAFYKKRLNKVEARKLKWRHHQTKVHHIALMDLNIYATSAESRKADRRKKQEDRKRRRQIKYNNHGQFRGCA